MSSEFPSKNMFHIPGTAVNTALIRKWSENMCCWFLCLFHNIGSGDCGYLRRKKYSYTEIALMTQKQLHISMLAGLDHCGRVVLIHCSSVTSACGTGWEEVLLCLTRRRDMPRFMYYRCSANCLAQKWRTSIYVLWLTRWCVRQICFPMVIFKFDSLWHLYYCNYAKV